MADYWWGFAGGVLFTILAYQLTIYLQRRRNIKRRVKKVSEPPKGE